MMANMKDPDNIIKVHEFKTERLIIRNMSKKDIDFIFQHFSQDDTNRYSSDDNLHTIEEAIEFYEKFIAPKPTRFRVGIVLKATNKLIGTIGYHHWSKKDFRAEIAFDLSKTYWGKGIMTEALQPLIQFGFNDMKLNRIETTAFSKNKRSIKTIERNGFKKEGILRQRFYFKGQFHDLVVFSLIKDDYKFK